MTDQKPMRLTIFGDFSCPFSALASHRAAALEEAARATIDWRGVQHLPDQPVGGLVVDGELASCSRGKSARSGLSSRRPRSFP